MVVAGDGDLLGRQDGAVPEVRYLAYTQEKGETLKAVVERLRVSEPTLQAWRRGQTPGSKKTRSGETRATPLLPVVVHPPKPPAASLTLLRQGSEG